MRRLVRKNVRKGMAAVAVAGLLLGACGGSSDSATADTSGANEQEAPNEASGTEVSLRNVKFEPGEITIAAGDTVTWTNEDTVLHTVTSGTGQEQGVPGVSENTDAEPDGLFDHEMPEGETFSFTFEKAGTFEYFCAIHPGMTGTVVVE